MGRRPQNRGRAAPYQGGIRSNRTEVRTFACSTVIGTIFELVTTTAAAALAVIRHVWKRERVRRERLKRITRRYWWQVLDEERERIEPTHTRTNESTPPVRSPSLASTGPRQGFSVCACLAALSRVLLFVSLFIKMVRPPSSQSSVTTYTLSP